MHHAQPFAAFVGRLALAALAVLLSTTASTAQTPTTLYSEDFESFNANYGLRNQGNSGGYNGTETEWSLSGNPSTLSDNNDYFMVEDVNGSKKFAGRDLDAEFVWTSKEIDVCGYTNLSFSVDLGEAGSMEPEDYIKLYYLKDDDSEVLIDEFFGEYNSGSMSETSFESTTSLRFRFKVRNNQGGEIHRFDNLLLTGQGVDVDSDCIEDSFDNCTDTGAINYDDAANGSCLFQVFYEPFTDDSQFSKNVNFSHDGNSDYWGIYDPDGDEDDFDGDSGQPSDVPSFSGVDGNFLVGEDMDKAPVKADPGILTWTNIDISAYDAALTFELDIAESGASGDEFVELYAKLSSSSTWVLLIDPGDDLEDIGSTLTKQTASSNFDGTSLDIRLRMYSDDDDDEVAVDDLRVLGTLSCTPVTVSASDATVQLSSSGSVTVTADTVSAISGGDCFTGSLVVSKTEGGIYDSSVTYYCSETGAQTLYVRATDGSNVSDATSVTVTVQDVTAPSVPSVSVSPIEIGAEGTATITASTYASGSTDNCSSEGLTYLVSTDGTSGFEETLDLDCTNLGALTLYFRVRDAAGNQSMSTLPAAGAFTVVDNIGPTITAVSPASVSLSSGTATVAVSDLTFTASDNCAASNSLTYEVSLTSESGFGSSVDVDCDDVPSVTLYFRASDGTNVGAEFSQSFTVTESTPPVISSTTGGTFDLDASGNATITASATYVTATDDCSSAGDLTYLVSTASGGTYAATVDVDCDDVGSLDLYFKVQDAAGNTSAASSATAFTIQDVTNPTVTASDVTLSLPGSSVSLSASDAGFNTSSDACGLGTPLVKLTSAPDGAYAASISFSSFGTYDVTLKATDVNGNPATSTATVTVTDVLYAEDLENESPSNASDLCSPTYTPSDGNFSLGCPGGTTSLTDEGGGDEYLSIEGAFGSDGSVNLVWQSATFSVDGASHVLVKLDAQSDGGIENASDGSLRDDFEIAVVKDGTESAIIEKSGQLNGAGGGGEATVDSSFVRSVDVGSVTNLALRFKARLSGAGEFYRVDDFVVCVDNNNNGVCDSDPSECDDVVVTASNATVQLSGSPGGVTVDATTVSAASTGDCFTVSSFQVSKDNSAFGTSVTYECGERGGNTLYVRATDGSNVSAAVAVTVTVEDDTDPTISSVTGATIDLDANGEATLTASSTYVTAADDCSSEGLTYLVSDASDGTFVATLALGCDDVGSKTVYFKVKDAAGNESAVSGPATFTVQDTVAPTALAQDLTVQLDASGAGSILASQVDNGSSDACGIASVSLSQTDFDCSHVGANQVTLTVTDNNNNTSTATATITVEDNVAPTITAVSPTSVQLSTGSATVATSGLTFTASDNCTSSDSLIYTVSKTSEGTFGASVDLGCGDIGTTTLYFIATDAAGNPSEEEFSQTFTVTDATGLSAIGQDFTAVLADDGTYTLDPNSVDNGSVGNCNTVLSVTPNSFDCEDLGATMVTLTITDTLTTDSASTTVTVTVVDQTAPIFNAMGSLSKELDANGNGVILPTDFGTLANPADACTDSSNVTLEIKLGTDPVTAYASSLSVDCSDVGTPFQVLVRATDAAGNASFSSGTLVTVSDTTAPVITINGAIPPEGLESNGTVPLEASDYFSATDNCTASGSLTYEISETSGSGFATSFVADCDDIGDKPFYFRATDAAGNVSAESSTSITIVDNTPPTAVANDRVLILDGASVSLSASDSNFNGSSDNCAITALVKLTSPGNEAYAASLDFSTAGIYSVTLQVTDAGGNVSTDTATITVTAEPDEVTLYTEDFEDDVLQNGNGSYPSFCALGVNEAHDANWTLECANGLLVVFPVSGNQGFNWYSASGSVTGDWFSTTIDVTSILEVSATLNVTELVAGGNGEGLFLYTILDGGTPVLQDSETGDFGTGTLDISGLSTGSATTLQIKVSGMGTSGADLFLTDVTVTGTCIDLDANGICDDDQNCVDVPSGTCGCTDVTACTYSSTASTNDPDSCQYVGFECLDPAGSTGYVWTVSDGTCSCSAAAFDQLYFEDFGSGGEAGGPGAPYGYEGYENIGIDGVDVINTAGESTDGWALEFDAASVGNGGLELSEPDYFATRYVEGGALTSTWSASVTDTVLASNWTLSRVGWSTELLDVSDYTNAHIGAQLYGVQGTTSDYIGVRLGDNRVPFAWTSATCTCSLTSFSQVSKLIALSEDTLRAQVDMRSGNDAGIHALNDVVISAWGKEGCTDSEATNYDATAQVDDGSCTGYAFATAYSQYDGGFSDKIWAGSNCEGDCGSAPFLDARSVAALTQDSSTAFNYVVSTGTTVTVDGTTDVEGNTGLKDLFVKNLIIEDGGKLVIPEGKRLRVFGTYIDNDGSGVVGDGMLCIDGELEISSSGPDTVTVQDFELPATATLDVAEGKTLAINGDLDFGSEAPASVQGQVLLSGDGTEVRGNGATFDGLVIGGSADVSVTAVDSLDIEGRLTLDGSGALDLGTAILAFRSNPGAVNGEKTAVLDPIPAGASLTGTQAAGRLAQSSNTAPTVEVERYVQQDNESPVFWGYTMYGTPISDAVVSDLEGIEGFTTSGWPGSDYPNSTSTVSFWDEASSSFVYATAADDSLYGRGCFLALLGANTPVLNTSGTLYSHVLDQVTTVPITRSSGNTDLQGWNVVFNPYQARLNWNAVISNASNAALIEDQYAIYDTQAKAFRRYGKNTQGVSWTPDETEGIGRINPGQAFWVRVRPGQNGGNLTFEPSMINNDTTSVPFIRSEQEEVTDVLVEVENESGASRMLLRFAPNGDAEGYVHGDMSRISASAVDAAQVAVVQGEWEFIAKSLPVEGADAAIWVASDAGDPTVMRVVEVLGNPSMCAHIVDNETGAVMMLREGEEMSFVLPASEAEEGRFTLHAEPFAVASGRMPSCPDGGDGAIEVELGDVVADLTVVDMASMTVVAEWPHQTGSVEIPMDPGEYSVQVFVPNETSLCHYGRRRVMVFPGEEPEVLDLEAEVAECNDGLGAVTFELYGGGQFDASLKQGNSVVWAEIVPSGEHVIDGLEPGEYLFKVDHPCMSEVDWVSVWDEGAPTLAVNVDTWVQADTDGGGWIEAECMGCSTSDIVDYQWWLDGELIAEGENLSHQVALDGEYQLELVAWSVDCSDVVSVDVMVGKRRIDSGEAVQWLGVHDGMLGVRFESAWSGATMRAYDATGRMLVSQSLGDVVGEVFLPVHQAMGWTSVEIRSAEGQVVRWFGFF